MAESIPKLTIGWLKKLGKQVYTVSHAKVCFYGWDSNGKQITVWEKIEALYRAVMITRYGNPVNLNDIRYQCCLYVTSGDGELLNTPNGSSSGFLKVYVSSGNYVKQEFLHGGTINSTDYRTYIRTYNKTTKEWSTWAQILTDKTKVISPSMITYGSTTCASSTETYPKNIETKTTSCYSMTNGSVGVKILKSGVYAICARAHFNAQTSTSTGYRRISLMF